jgi:modulator of FtsH protease HflK
MTNWRSMRTRFGVLMNEGGPWGSGPRGNGGDGGKEGGPRNPWARPENPSGSSSGQGPSAIDELMRKARESFGGGGNSGGSGGGTPFRPEARGLWLWLGIGVVGIWIAMTCVHRIGPQERGVVTTLGSYSRTLTPGINLTLPAPIQSVSILNVEEIRVIDIGSPAGEAEKLVLTGDRNIIDLAYSVRWNIRSPELYQFQIAEVDSTIAEVAESAMRAVVASVTLESALGEGRTVIEQQVQQRMQDILDRYGAGVRIQGIAIKQADPPNAVNDAFKEVTAAQQTAETYTNQAQAYAQQLLAGAQGEAAAFDKVFEQYRLSPEVTRRRMYYETMEKVLSGVDKTIVETGNVTPYLPLREIGRKEAAATTTVTEPAR